MAIFGLALPVLLPKIMTALQALKAALPFLEKIFDALQNNNGDSSGTKDAIDKTIKDEKFQEELAKAADKYGVPHDVSNVKDLSSLIKFLEAIAASSEGSKLTGLTDLIANLKALESSQGDAAPPATGGGQLQPTPGSAA
jgi:hypothetical protein